MPLGKILESILKSPRATRDVPLLAAGVGRQEEMEPPRRDPSEIVRRIEAAENGVNESVARRRDREPEYRKSVAAGDLKKMELFEREDADDVLTEKRLRAIIPELNEEYEEATRAAAKQILLERTAAGAEALIEIRALLVRSPALLNELLRHCESIDQRLQLVRSTNAELAGAALQHLQTTIPSDLLPGIRAHEQHVASLRQILTNWTRSTAPAAAPST